ncbi:hypothetical protein [Sphingomonas sp.]|uniref:hypothetical protein n=1 Tax=Sphingomonas sp. TaxID=28214 RepID=UPI003AFFCC1D
MIALALLLQAAPTRPTPAPAPASATPERFSILADPCARIVRDAREVVVCGTDPATAQRLPYPDEVVPDHAIPSNPQRSGLGALAAAASPCATLMSGCQVGVGPPIGPMANAVINGIRNATANRREAKARAADGDRRQAIDLKATGPAGRLEP